MTNNRSGNWSSYYEVNLDHMLPAVDVEIENLKINFGQTRLPKQSVLLVKSKVGN